MLNSDGRFVVWKSLCRLLGQDNTAFFSYSSSPLHLAVKDDMWSFKQKRYKNEFNNFLLFAACKRLLDHKLFQIDHSIRSIVSELNIFKAQETRSTRGAFL